MRIKKKALISKKEVVRYTVWANKSTNQVHFEGSIRGKIAKGSEQGASKHNKITVDLKEFQNKARHIETLESAVEVKDKALKNQKLSHDNLKEKLKESTCKLRANTKETAKLNKKLERKT